MERIEPRLAIPAAHGTALNRGTVTSYAAAKGWGYIAADDGMSCWFHHGSFDPKISAEDVAIGARVTFDPTPAPKGMTARKIRFVQDQVACWSEPDRFIVSREVEPRHGEVLHTVGLVRSRGHRRPDDAREELLQAATRIGANGVVELDRYTGTGSSGNYRYTLHYFSGRPALIMERRMTTDRDLAAETERNIQARKQRMDAGYTRYKMVRRAWTIAKIISAAIIIIGILAVLAS